MTLADLIVELSFVRSRYVTHSMDRPTSAINRKISFAGLTLLAAVLLLHLGAPSAVPDKTSTVITIAHTNDIHSHLAAGTSGDEPVGGIARIAGLIRRMRANEDYVVVLDAGDFLSGTPFYNFYKGRAEIECMNAMGYDAAVVGNHELDGGVGPLLDLAGRADFPFMSANLRRRGSGETVFQPYLLLEADDITVALLGLTTGDIYGRVRPSSVAALAAASPIETARRLVPALQKEAQAVVVLSHLGLDEDKKLAREVPGIDLIVGGDTHVLLRKPVKIVNPESDRPTYIVQAGSYGRYLGRVDMFFSRGTLSRIEASVIPVRSVIGEDPKVRKIVGKYWNSMEAFVTKVIARARGPFPRDRTLKTRESALGDLIADVTRYATGADFAIQNAAGVRGGFHKGPITVWDVYSALPFDNRLLKLELSGDQVQELMDGIARRTGRGSFCQVSGISFEIVSGRAANVAVAGTPLDKGRTYTVGVIDYLAEGGDHYEVLARARVLSSTARFQRDIAVEYLRKLGSLRPRLEGRIRAEAARR